MKNIIVKLQKKWSVKLKRNINKGTVSTQFNRTDSKPLLPIITLEQVTLSFKQQLIFDALDLEIYPGDKIALLGKSGVGKSSLIKLISGLEQGFSGQITTRAQRIGYVFQEPRLLPWLSVGQNIDEVLKAQGLTKLQRDVRLVELLTQVGLIAYQQHFSHQLSGGMAQRASLARAFAADPDLLILDEPFSALDKQSVDELTQLLQSFLTDQITLLYISHNIEQVIGMSNTSLLLKPANKCLRYSIKTPAERAEFLNDIYPSELK